MARRRKAAVNPSELAEPEIEAEEAAGESEDEIQYIRNLNEFICITPISSLKEEKVKLSLQRHLVTKHKAIDEMVDKYLAEGFSLDEINSNCSVVSQLMPEIKVVDGKNVVVHKFELIGLD